MDEDRLIAAAAFMPAGDSQYLFFHSEDLRPYKRQIALEWHKTVVPLLTKPTYIVRDDQLESSIDFVMHFGFKQIAEDIWLWRG